MYSGIVEVFLMAQMMVSMVSIKVGWIFVQLLTKIGDLWLSSPKIPQKSACLRTKISRIMVSLPIMFPIVNQKIERSFSKFEAYERTLRVQTKIYSHKEKKGLRTLHKG